VKPTSALLACLVVACSSDDTPQNHGVTIKPDSSVVDTGAQPDVSVPLDAATDQNVGDVVVKDAPSSCTATTVVLAGNASTLLGGSATGTSAITVAAVAGNTIDRIAIAPNGTGFVAALRSSGNAVAGTVFTGSWADTVALTNATTIDAPALATIQSASHLIYQDAAFKYEHRKYVSSTWDASDDPVGGGGNLQSFGAKAPAVASSGTDLVLLQGGSDNNLYDQIWTGGVWKSATQHTVPVQNTISPTLITLSTGDLLGVYMRQNDYKLMWTTRTGTTWSTPALIDTNAFANDPVAMVALANGRALLVYRGSNQQPYFSAFDPLKNPQWTVPAALLGTNPTITSVPSVAAGVCGDDALVAYTKQGGGVEFAHFSGGSFTGPDAVSGTTGTTYVAVATKP
jgi:hypothetical protein